MPINNSNNKNSSGSRRPQSPTISRPMRNRSTARSRPNVARHGRGTPRRSRGYRGRKNFRSRIVTFLGRTVFFLLAFFIISSIFIISFLYNFNHVNTPNIIYELSLSDKLTTLKLTRDKAIYNGVKYIPIMSIAEPLNLAVTGDVSQYSYIHRDSGEYIRFYTDSTKVVINNTETRMNAPARLISGELYVPSDFIFENMIGIKSSPDDNKPDVLRLEKDDTAKSVGFVLKDPSPETVIDEVVAFGEIYKPPFTANISEYEEYMNPSNIDEYLFLINKKNRVTADYIPDDLTNSPDTIQDGRNTIKLRLNAEKALEAMLKETRALGFPNIALISGYRSYEYQQKLLDAEIINYASYGDKAEEMASKAVMYPGASEHQTGLAADICSTNVPGEDFGDTNEGKWLEENAHKFGFILRYPKNKTDITEIIYEPWHFRYVGRYHATRMYELGLCMEEYMQYLGLPIE